MRVAELCAKLAVLVETHPDAVVVIQDTDSGRFLPLHIGFCEEIALARPEPLSHPPEGTLVVHGLMTESLPCDCRGGSASV